MASGGEQGITREAMALVSDFDVKNRMHWALLFSALVGVVLLILGISPLVSFTALSVAELIGLIGGALLLTATLSFLWLHQYATSRSLERELEGLRVSSEALKVKAAEAVERTAEVRGLLKKERAAKTKKERALAEARRELDSAWRTVVTLSLLLQSSRESQLSTLRERDQALEAASNLETLAQKMVEKNIKKLGKRKARAVFRLMVTFLPYSNLFDVIVDGLDLEILVEDVHEIREVLEDVAEAAHWSDEVKDFLRGLSKVVGVVDAKATLLLESLDLETIDMAKVPGRAKEVFQAFSSLEKELDSERVLAKLVQEMPKPHPLKAAIFKADFDSIRDFAKQANLDARTVRRIIRGGAKFQPDTWAKICRALGIDRRTQEAKEFRQLVVSAVG